MICDNCGKFTGGPLPSSVAHFILEHAEMCECLVPEGFEQPQGLSTRSVQSVQENYEKDLHYLQQQIDGYQLAIECLVKEIEKLKEKFK